MRIEFHTDRETVAELRLIIYVCEQAIAAQEANQRTIFKDTEFRSPPADPANQRAMYEAVAAACATDPVPPTTAVDPNTGEVITTQEFARRAFGAEFVKPGLTAAEAFGRFSLPAASSPSAPPVAPVGVAPSAGLPPIPSAPSAPTAGAVERDDKGDPYDARIHSEARTKNNDGSWRFRRKLDEAVKAQVLAEIRSAPVGIVQPNVGAVPPPPPPPPAAVPPPPPVIPPPPLQVPAPPAARLPDPPLAVVVPAPPVNPTATVPAPPSAIAASSVAATASGPITFRDLVVKLNKAMAAGTVTQEALQLACVELGLDSPSALASPEYAHLAPALDTILFPNG